MEILAGVRGAETATVATVPTAKLSFEFGQKANPTAIATAKIPIKIL
jgi:hypothetical protein